MNQKAVLMSIRPQYADLIFSGRKKIELRRVCPKVDLGDLILVYVSGPRMALVGGFEVAGIVSAAPDVLCQKWLKGSGLAKEDFLSYFKGVSLAFGIKIGRTWQLEEAKDLQSLRRSRGGFHPPQSYRYLRKGELNSLVK